MDNEIIDESNEGKQKMRLYLKKILVAKHNAYFGVTFFALLHLASIEYTEYDAMDWAQHNSARKIVHNLIKSNKTHKNQ